MAVQWRADGDFEPETEERAAPAAGCDPDILSQRRGAFSTGGYIVTTPDWIKPGVYGALIGAAAVGFVGFTYGGWVTSGTAHDRALAMSRDDVAAAMTPVCLDMAQSDPDRVAKLAKIRDAATYRRRDALMETGWTTMPGAKSPNRDIAKACLASLDVDASPTQPDTTADEG